jgi:protein-disulfide isomerase
VRNFHLPLPEDIYADLHDEAQRSNRPATSVARQAIQSWLHLRRKIARREAIAAFAAEQAGAALDLDVELEAASIEHLFESVEALDRSAASKQPLPVTPAVARPPRHASYNQDMKLFALAFAATLSFAAIPDAPKSKTLGNLAAPMRLELYGDFTCPHCKHLHEDILPMIVRDFVDTGKAYIVFRDYTLTGAGHQYSRDAAAYATAAARIGKYHAAADAIFKTQQNWLMNGQIWQNISSAFTPDEQKKIQALVKDPSVLAEVQSDVDAGNMVPVQSTPTMVIVYKGKKQPWAVWSNYPFFQNYLDSVLTH